MTIALRIAAIWIAVAIVFLVFIWPDIARRIRRNQEEVERAARVKRLRSLYTEAQLIIAAEAVEREWEGSPFALDPPNEAA